MGLATLSKLQGAALLGLAGIVIVWIAWRKRSPRTVFVAVPLVLAPALAIAGWWFVRNRVLYGDWLGTSVLVGVSGLPQTLPRLGQLLGELNGARMSFWGLFGWFNIILPQGIYVALDLITVAALAGLAILAWRGFVRRHFPAGWDAEVMLVLAVWSAILLSLLFYWTIFTNASQGRLLFPGIGAFGPLLIAGLYVWGAHLRLRWRVAVLGALPVGLLICSLYALIVLFPAAYRAPRPLAQVPASATRVDLVYDGKIDLLAVELPKERYRKGDVVPVTLFMSSACGNGRRLRDVRSVA